MWGDRARHEAPREGREGAASAAVREGAPRDVDAWEGYTVCYNRLNGTVSRNVPSQNGGGLTFTDVGRLGGVSKPTAHGLLAVLVGLGAKAREAAMALSRRMGHGYGVHRPKEGMRERAS